MSIATPECLKISDGGMGNDYIYGEPQGVLGSQETHLSERDGILMRELTNSMFDFGTRISDCVGGVSTGNTALPPFQYPPWLG